MNKWTLVNDGLLILSIAWGLRGWWCYTKLRNKYRLLYNIVERKQKEWDLYTDSIDRAAKKPLPFKLVLAIAFLCSLAVIGATVLCDELTGKIKSK